VRLSKTRTLVLHRLCPTAPSPSVENSLKVGLKVLCKIREHRAEEKRDRDRERYLR
jgi:hypothetical protein